MKIVLLEWDDSNTVSGWQHKSRKDILSESHCVSVGIIVRQTNQDLTLCQSVSGELQADFISIPKPVIKRIRQLGVIPVSQKERKL